MQTRSLIALAFLVGLIATAALYLTAGTPPPKLSIKRPNFILISLDTLRADRLGAYGYARDTSPNLDRFAESALVYENAVSPSSWTLPSHVSLFSGMYPSAHGVTLPKGQKIGAETQLLAEILAGNGYRNFAYVAGGYVAKRFGFSRGFESYTSRGRGLDDRSEGFEKTLTRVKEKITSLPKEAPFFIFLHTYLVHCPYNPPEPFASKFKTPGAERLDLRYCGAHYNKRPDLTKNHALYLSDHYDGSISYLDSLLGVFFSELEQQGTLENTVIIITSDHGDSFLEHGRIGHQESLHNELLMVPLLIRGPGLGSARVKNPVSLVDIFPTVLELAEIPVPNVAQGHSLLARLDSTSGRTKFPERYISELDGKVQLRSLINPLSDHLIVNLGNDIPLYYDLGSDRAEQNNIAGSSGKVVGERRAELEAILKSFTTMQTEEVDAPTQEQIERLKSLGYM